VLEVPLVWETFKGGHNATKAVSHLAKVKGRDIQPCHVSIPSKFLSEYKAFWGAKSLEKSEKRKRIDAITEKIDDKQQSIAVMMESKRQQSSNSITSSSAQRSISNITSSLSSGFIIEAGWESRLTMAIADFVHSKGLAFNATAGPYFAKVIQLTRCVPVSYVPPDRKQIGGKLLELSYNAKIESYITKLRKDADVFGLSMFGDGATVKQMPLLNIMCSGFDERCAVLDVVDCTEHMAVGEKKDASYIAFLFNQWIEKIDPKGKLVDLILFDGASNVQKGGQVTTAKYPRISVLHGAEHVVSLFFSDIAKVWQMKHFVNRYRLIYRIFGSGSTHAPYAMFRDQARMFNGGVKIGLIRAADTRMAGYFIAMNRMLRLRDPLLATINSVQFKGIISKKKMLNAVSEILLDTEFFCGLPFGLCSPVGCVAAC
jgi:hypothetical protein